MLLAWRTGWIGAAGTPWQVVAGVGMACAVTALPILLLLMEKLSILREPFVTGDTFTALLPMAVASTMLTVPMAAPSLRRLRRGTPCSSDFSRDAGIPPSPCAGRG